MDDTEICQIGFVVIFLCPASHREHKTYLHIRFNVDREGNGNRLNNNRKDYNSIVLLSIRKKYRNKFTSFANDILVQIIKTFKSNKLL